MGMTEVQGKLRLLREAVRDQIARDAVRAGADVILLRMVELAPVLDARTAQSTAAEPGTLKSGLRRSTPIMERLGYISCLVGASRRVAYLARWIEYGHRLVKGGWSKISVRGRRGPGREIGVVPAYPFLRPAREATEQEALARFAETARNEMKEVLG